MTILRSIAIASAAVVLVCVATACKRTPGTPLGCFKDEGDSAPGPQGRDLGGDVSVIPKMTLSSCLDHCASKGFTYAGVQYANQCFCGNTYGKFGKDADTECNTPCEGDAKQTCGGTWHSTIYKVK